MEKQFRESKYLVYYVLVGFLGFMYLFGTFVAPSGYQTAGIDFDKGGEIIEPEPEPVPIKIKNVPPVASITTIFPNPAEIGETINFRGNGADSDGEIASYEWVSSINGVFGKTTDVSTTSLSKGEHGIFFRVKDNDNQWSLYARTKVAVIAAVPVEEPIPLPVEEPVEGSVPVEEPVPEPIKIANEAPIAIAGATPISGNAPLTVSFSARSSYDVDGQIGEYIWEFGDGTQAAGATPTHTYSTAGTYTATVTVTDNLGATTARELIIKVGGGEQLGCTANNFVIADIEGLDVTELANSVGFPGQWALYVTGTPIAIEKTTALKPDPRNAVTEIIPGWENDIEEHRKWCIPNQRWYWVTYPAQLTQVLG